MKNHWLQRSASFQQAFHTNHTVNAESRMQLMSRPESPITASLGLSLSNVEFALVLMKVKQPPPATRTVFSVQSDIADQVITRLQATLLKPERCAVP